MRGNPQTVLVLTDNKRGRWNRRLSGRAAFVLPLGLDPAELSAALPAGGWDILDPARFAEDAQTHIRTFVPQLIYELPRQWVWRDTALFDFFDDPEGNLWWLLELAEKSPMRGSFINRLYFLALVRAAIGARQYDEIFVDVEDRQLATIISQGLTQARAFRRQLSFPSLWRAGHVIRHAVIALGTVAFHLAQVAVLKLSRLEHYSYDHGSLAFFSFYPAWWSQAHTTEATEWFFDGLPEMLRRHAPVSYTVWMSAGPLALWRRRSTLRALARDRGLVPLQPLLDWQAAVELLRWRHLRRLGRVQVAARRLRAEFLGFPIARLVADEILRSMCSTEFFRDLLLRRAAARLAGTGRVRAVIYRLEFQPFERALLMGLQGRVTTVAFQHSVFGRNYLPYFFQRGELNRRGPVDAREMPTPDMIMTTGQYGRDVMIRNGFSADRVGVCGPVRYARLLEYRRCRPSPAETRRRLGLDRTKTIFLVTTSVVRAESRALIFALRDALARLPQPPVIIFKSHPAMRLDEEFQRLIARRLPPGEFQLLSSDESIYDHLVAANAAVLTGTTVAIEAMLLGVLPIVFESLAVFDAKSLREIAAGCLMAHDGATLAQAMEQVMTGGPSLQEHQVRWPGVIAEVFGATDEDPHARFAQLLTAQGLLP